MYKIDRGFTINVPTDTQVLTLCMWELVFYAVDYVYLLDCNAPIAIGITADPIAVLHLKTLSFYLVKEGLAMLILWFHGSIAYTLYAYTVQKVRPVSPSVRPSGPLDKAQAAHNPARLQTPPIKSPPYCRHHQNKTNTQISPARLLRNQRIWALLLVAATYMAVHATLSLTLRRGLVGYYIGRISYDALVIPVSLLVIARWYILAIRELTRPPPAPAGGGGGGGSESIALRQLSLSQSQAGGTLGADLEAGLMTPRASMTPIGGSGSGSSGVAPINRRLALRLLMILGTTSTIWLLLFIVDVSAWMHHRRGNRDTGLLVMVTMRSALARSVGLFDAVILGMDAHLLAFCCASCCARRWARAGDGRGRGSASASASASGATGGGGGGGGGGKGAETFTGEADEEEDDREGPSIELARTPASMLGAEPASFLARPVMLRHRTPSTSNFSLAGLGRGGSSSSSNLLSVQPGSPEEEANAAVRAAEALRRARAPPLRPKALRVFVTTWNMGGCVLGDRCDFGCLVGWRALPLSHTYIHTRRTPTEWTWTRSPPAPPRRRPPAPPPAATTSTATAATAAAAPASSGAAPTCWPGCSRSGSPGAKIFTSLACRSALLCRGCARSSGPTSTRGRRRRGAATPCSRPRLGTTPSCTASSR